MTSGSGAGVPRYGWDWIRAIAFKLGLCCLWAGSACWEAKTHRYTGKTSIERGVFRKVDKGHPTVQRGCPTSVPSSTGLDRNCGLDADQQ